MSENKTETDLTKKFLKSSIEGQKQLMKFGESLAIQKQIDDRRLDKDEKINKYIQDIGINLPEGLKSQDYTNSMRDFYESNKTFIEKYKIIKTFVTSPKDYDEKKILDDMMNLYYGYKLKEQFRKKIEKELEKEKESHARTQENYNDVAIESSEHEDTIDKLEFIKYKYECIIIGTLLLLFISNVILSIYLYKGPTLLYNDTISFCCNIGYCIYLCWSFLKIIIDFSISLYTDVPEYVRCIYLIIILSMSVFIYKYDISFSMILDKSEEMFNNTIKVSRERLVNCKDFIKNRYILLFSSSEKNKKKG
jgi:hypothetical protein